MAVAPQRVRQFVGHRNDPTVTALGCVDDSLPPACWAARLACFWCAEQLSALSSYGQVPWSIQTMPHGHPVPPGAQPGLVAQFSQSNTEQSHL